MGVEWSEDGKDISILGPGTCADTLDPGVPTPAKTITKRTRFKQTLNR
jgi:hypothetical protein